MTPKPAYEALRRLIEDEWRTEDQRLTTDAQGLIRFRAFLGDYVARVAGREATFAVKTAGRADIRARVS
jgi:hypothetical protein